MVEQESVIGAAQKVVVRIATDRSAKYAVALEDVMTLPQQGIDVVVVEK